MRVLISRGFVLIAVVAFSALGGCGQTTHPEEAVSIPTGIEHLSIGPMEIEAVANVEGPEAIADVLSLLSEEQLSALVEGDVLCVEEPSVALAVATQVGLDTSNPVVIEGGILLAADSLTWGQLKCCYLSLTCCHKEKEQ